MCNQSPYIEEEQTTQWSKEKVQKTNYDLQKQPENCENRNDPDLVQAFLKKWWVESDFNAPNLRFHYGCHYNSIYPAITIFAVQICYTNKFLLYVHILRLSLLVILP
jgi:hypothetical protein